MLRLARVLGVVLLAAVLFRTFAFEAFNIPSGSMMPTLLAGDEVLVSKFAYRIGPAGPAFWQNRVPARGDVVVFTPTNNPDAD